MRQLDIRANRAQREAELALRKEERITLAQASALFGSWLRLLQEHLDMQAFAKVVPMLRKLVEEQGVVDGSPGAEAD